MIYIEYKDLPSFSSSFNWSFENGNGQPKELIVPKTNENSY